jgi:hypothetical protein
MPPVPFDPASYRVVWPISESDVDDVRWNARATQEIAEGLREAILSRRLILPQGASRGAAAVAENLAVAAVKLRHSKLDDDAERASPSLKSKVDTYHDRLREFGTMSQLVDLEDWDGLRTRYGSLKRDAAPSCMGVVLLAMSLAGSFAVAMRGIS